MGRFGAWIAACAACGQPASAVDAPGVDTVAIVDAACATAPERGGPYPTIAIAGESRGVMDPSVKYGATATFGVLAYTAVPDQAHTRLAIAASGDAGATWTFQADVSQSSAITITTSDQVVCGAGQCTGTLVQETASVVVDASDPDSTRRLKVFGHEYFFGSSMNFQLGYLAMWTASTPAGPWTETKLFGWPSSSPLSTAGVAYNIKTTPDLAGLADCVIVGEPGALVRADGTLDLALACPRVEGSAAAMGIRLVRSADHGQTWQYVGELLAPNDAAALGGTFRMVSAGDLYFADNAYHVVVTPIATVDYASGPASGARGCVVVSIADLDHAAVARCGGAPVVEAAYRGLPGQFVGGCTIAPGASAAGMLIPIPDVLHIPPTFQLYAAREGVP